MTTRPISIRRRLIAMTTLSSSFALLLACAAFLGYELLTFRRFLVDTLTADARVVGYGLAAPLLFDDRPAAEASLEALKNSPGIRSAVLTDANGKVFATYGTPGPAQALPPEPGGLSYRFETDRLLLSVPVSSGGAPIGTLTLESTLEARDQRVRRYLLLTASVLAAALLASLAFSSRLQRSIVQPVTRLTDAAVKVSRYGDYSLRVEVPTHDELGVLATAFNDMLGKIEQQNKGLLATAELEAQNSRIREANRLKSEFLANMSHELRTPLNAIIGFGELLYDGNVPPDSAEHHEFLGDIVKSGHHLLQLINDVLDLAKVEAGKLEFRPEPVQLDQLVGEVVGIIRALAISKRIEITVGVDPSLANGVFLDPSRLKQIVYNFVSNALKFTPPGGRIAVRAVPQGPSLLRLEVEDTGPGIAPADIEKLFTEFQQLDAGAAKQHGGTGLGLALTRRLAEAQGGSVGVSSTPGLGSVFHAVLPRQSTVGSPVVRGPRQRPPAGAPSVLVIEDDAQDHAILVEALSNAGYAVHAAATGAQALALCKERRFNAITLDLLLPDMSGQELLRRIRASGPNSDVPIVVVTVVTERGAIAGLAVNDFLSKPIDTQALFASLQRAGLQPGQSTSILVVDDDASALRLMTAALDRLGYRTLPIADAEEALLAAARVPVGAVVLDLLMPTLDGFQFLERFRNSPGHELTPVLIWTAKDLDAGEQARLGRLAQGVVQKRETAIPALLADLRRFLAGAEAS